MLGDCLPETIKKALNMSNTCNSSPSRCLRNGKTGIPAPGYALWVLSNGHWTTFLTGTKRTYQGTFGLLTLCPSWKESPLRVQYWAPVKRHAGSGESWKPPRPATQAGGGFQAFLSPGMMALEKRYPADN